MPIPIQKALPTSPTLRRISKVLGWLLALIMFSLNIYQWYNTQDVENKLHLAEARIQTAQDELDKARGFIEEMESNLKTYEAKDEAVNKDIDSLIGTWKADLLRMKSVFSLSNSRSHLQEEPINQKVSKIKS